MTHYREPRPEDFDFPMSESFRCFVDPTLERYHYQPKQRASEIKAPPFIPNDHIVVLLVDLENRLNRHIDASKKKDRL